MKILKNNTRKNRLIKELRRTSSFWKERYDNLYRLFSIVGSPEDMAVEIDLLRSRLKEMDEKCDSIKKILEI